MSVEGPLELRATVLSATKLDTGALLMPPAERGGVRHPALYEEKNVYRPSLDAWRCLPRPGTIPM